MVEISLKSSDLLYLSASINEVSSAYATIIIVPGLNEYKERYFEMIDYFVNNKFNIVIYDPRGQGKSINNENTLGFISDAQKLIDDFKNVVKYTEKRFPNIPIYVVADSLGTLPVINYLPDNESIKKIVLTSPLYQKDIEGNLKMAKFMLNIMGKNKENSYFQNLLGFGAKSVVVNDINEKEKIKNDANCFYNYKNKSVYEILRLEENIKKIKFNNNIKLAIATGALDTKLSGKENITELVNVLNKDGLTNIGYFDYPNMGHKILFDNGKKLVWQDILAFFQN